ncbi:MAG: hypothetical protein M5U28_50020 [Sandaracinaceae bacterium]|nr:hypothetical protein [Sandaracinaceae bacterium]
MATESVVAASLLTLARSKTLSARAPCALVHDGAVDEGAGAGGRRVPCAHRVVEQASQLRDHARSIAGSAKWRRSGGVFADLEARSARVRRGSTVARRLRCPAP